jgi:hypothetical protein
MKANGWHTMVPRRCVLSASQEKAAVFSGKWELSAHRISEPMAEKPGLLFRDAGKQPQK